MEKLGLNLGYLIVQILNFGIVFIALYVWIYKPLLGMLEKRRKTIAQGLEDARIAAEARANAEQEAAKILADAQSKAAATVREATERAQLAAKEVRAAAEAEEARKRREHESAEARARPSAVSAGKMRLRCPACMQTFEINTDPVIELRFAQLDNGAMMGGRGLECPVCHAESSWSAWHELWRKLS